MVQLAQNSSLREALKTFHDDRDEVLVLQYLSSLSPGNLAKYEKQFGELTSDTNKNTVIQGLKYTAAVYVNSIKIKDKAQNSEYIKNIAEAVISHMNSEAATFDANRIYADRFGTTLASSKYTSNAEMADALAAQSASQPTLFYKMQGTGDANYTNVIVPLSGAVFEEAIKKVDGAAKAVTSTYSSLYSSPKISAILSKYNVTPFNVHEHHEVINEIGADNYGKLIALETAAAKAANALMQEGSKSVIDLQTAIEKAFDPSAVYLIDHGKKRPFRDGEYVDLVKAKNENNLPEELELWYKSPIAIPGTDIKKDEDTKLIGQLLMAAVNRITASAEAGIKRGADASAPAEAAGKGIGGIASIPESMFKAQMKVFSSGLMSAICGFLGKVLPNEFGGSFFRGQAVGFAETAANSAGVAAILNNEGISQANISARAVTGELVALGAITEGQEPSLNAEAAATIQQAVTARINAERAINPRQPKRRRHKTRNLHPKKASHVPAPD